MILTELIPVIRNNKGIHITNLDTNTCYTGTLNDIPNELKNLNVTDIEADDFHSIYVSIQRNGNNVGDRNAVLSRNFA